MKKSLMLFMLMLGLAGCGLVHKNSIEQGNIFNDEMVSRLHRGMSESQVRSIMGTPLLLNTFTGGRVDYVYTFKPGKGCMTEKYVTLQFRNHRLVDITYKR